MTKSKIEFYGLPLPRFAKHLRIWGEAGTVKLPKDGKVKERGVTCVFIGYASNHEGDCYRMWNPVTGMVMLSRDVVFLQRMFFEQLNSDATKQQPVVYIPGKATTAILQEEAIVTDKVHVIDVTPPTTSQEGGEDLSSAGKVVHFEETNDTDDNGETKEETPSVVNDGFTQVTTRSGRCIALPSRFREVSAVASMQNYFECLENYDDDEMELVTEVSNAMVDKISGVGASLGGGFANTSELRVMKYEEAITGPDSDKWATEVDKEHDRMVKNKTWEAVKRSDLPPGTIPIDSTWAMKKKSNGTLRGRLNARGFKQIEGVHYDGSSIHAPVTNSATIRIVLVLMLMATWMGILLDVNGAFLHGEFTDGEKIYMKVPKGMEKHYPKDVVLLLRKCIYGLKQAAMAFWKRLLICMRSMGFEHSMSDPCLYYRWTEGSQWPGNHYLVDR